MKKIVDIYRSKKKDGAYIYVEKGKDLKTLPEALLQQTGHLDLAMTLLITPDKKLSNANAKNVLAAIDENGFYLQLPPQAEGYMQAMQNDKLTNRPI